MHVFKYDGSSTSVTWKNNRLLGRGIKRDVKEFCKLKVELKSEEWLLLLGAELMQQKEKPHWLSAGKAGPGNRKEVAGLPLPSLWFQLRNPTLAGKRRLGLMERHPNHSLFCQTEKGPLCFIYAFLFLLSQLIFAFGITVSLITC